MLKLVNWNLYGYCKKCKVHEQEPCKGFIRLRPCKDRESYEDFRKRYAKILGIHYQRTIAVDEIDHYLPGGNTQ